MIYIPVKPLPSVITSDLETSYGPAVTESNLDKTIQKTWKTAEIMAPVIFGEPIGLIKEINSHNIEKVRQRIGYNISRKIPLTLRSLDSPSHIVSSIVQSSHNIPSTRPENTFTPAYYKRISETRSPAIGEAQSMSSYGAPTLFHRDIGGHNPFGNPMHVHSSRVPVRPPESMIEKFDQITESEEFIRLYGQMSTRDQSKLREICMNEPDFRTEKMILFCRTKIRNIENLALRCERKLRRLSTDSDIHRQINVDFINRLKRAGELDDLKSIEKEIDQECVRYKTEKFARTGGKILETVADATIAKRRATRDHVTPSFLNNLLVGLTRKDNATKTIGTLLETFVPGISTISQQAASTILLSLDFGVTVSEAYRDYVTDTIEYNRIMRERMASRRGDADAQKESDDSPVIG